MPKEINKGHCLQLPHRMQISHGYCIVMIIELDSLVPYFYVTSDCFSHLKYRILKATFVGSKLVKSDSEDLTIPVKSLCTSLDAKRYASQGVWMQYIFKHVYFSEIFFTYSNLLKFLYRAMVFQK